MRTNEGGSKRKIKSQRYLTLIQPSDTFECFRTRQKIPHKMSRQKKIIKPRAKINEIKTKKQRIEELVLGENLQD